MLTAANRVRFAYVKLAIIGNCAYQALIDDRARVRWLCWPRFDSSFVFGSLLDETRGGHCSVSPDVGPDGDDYVTEQAYLPNTNILRTIFRSSSGSFEVTDFAPRYLQHDRSFKPTMLMRRIRRLSGDPRVCVRVEPVYDYGEVVPQSYTASNHIQWNIPGGPLRLTTNVPLTYISEARSFVLERDTYVSLAWGSPLEAPLAETYARFFVATRKYWHSWVKHTTIPGCFQKEVIRSALALKLHQYEDTGAITAAATTSIPEEEGSGRNWDYRYCWLRDSYFTFRAMGRLGQFEELEGFVGFLKNIAHASPDRIQPMFAISGESKLTEKSLDHLDGYLGNGPVRVGNAAYKQLQHDVYGEMMAAIAPLFLDARFDDPCHQQAADLVRRLLVRIESTMNQPDAGLWEYRGNQLVHTFSLLMHWTGSELASRIGARIGDDKLQARGQQLSRAARQIIESQCWQPDAGFYGDSTATGDPDASLFMMVNLGYLDPTSERAESHVRALAKRLMIRDPLMHRYEHEDDFGRSRSPFTACGVWFAEALARLGHKDEAEAACRKLVSYANHVGLLSEDVDPKTGEQWGNFPQTYSHVGLINTAFAIRQMADDLGD